MIGLMRLWPWKLTLPAWRKRAQACEDGLQPDATPLVRCQDVVWFLNPLSQAIWLQRAPAYVCDGSSHCSLDVSYWQLGQRHVFGRERELLELDLSVCIVEIACHVTLQQVGPRKKVGDVKGSDSNRSCAKPRGGYNQTRLSHLCVGGKARAVPGLATEAKLMQQGCML